MIGLVIKYLLTSSLLSLHNGSLLSLLLFFWPFTHSHFISEFHFQSYRSVQERTLVVQPVTVSILFPPLQYLHDSALIINCGSSV